MAPIFKKQNKTREEIVRVFKDLVIQGHHEKITVQTISELSNISRKTFYYHFPDKTKLIRWIFRYELGSALAEQCSVSDLIFLPGDSRLEYPEIPYYARTPIGVRSLDGSRFFRILGSYLQDNREYYRQVVSNRSFSNFIRYITALYQQAFIGDVRFVLGGRMLPQESISQLGRYFSNAAIVNYFDALIHSNSDLRCLIPEDFSNINHESLSGIIDGHFAKSVNKFSFFES